MIGVHSMASKIQHTLAMIKNQGVYNDRNRLDSRPYTDSNAAQSRSGSVSEQGLGASSSNYKYELQRSKDGSNSDIGYKGFGS